MDEVGAVSYRLTTDYRLLTTDYRLVRRLLSCRRGALGQRRVFIGNVSGFRHLVDGYGLHQHAQSDAKSPGRV